VKGNHEQGLTTAGWHNRYLQQAQWTNELRRFLYQKADLTTASRVLDVGCGTGALLSELIYESSGKVHGLDIDRSNLVFARSQTSEAFLTEGDAHRLPYATASFDLALCHFVLLWVGDPDLVIREMLRVIRPGGMLLVLAEPDYGGRIDFPKPLEKLGEWQTQALKSQGANPYIGRRLSSIFKQAGVENVNTGVLGGQWSSTLNPDDWETEWAVLYDDIKKSPAAASIQELFPADDLDLLLQELKNLDYSAWQSGERVLYVPTFYAWGSVPG
jgi:ubiquinone/menaquinone biosynthesis C-methylase UbiE